MPELGRFRTNMFQQAHGVGAVFRVIPPTTPSFESLRLPPVIKKLADAANGVVLVTGPTGSGKTTTLAAIVDYINRYVQAAHHHAGRSNRVRARAGSVRASPSGKFTCTSESFSSALRSALRESPDVVIVGELRDLETTGLA